MNIFKSKQSKESKVDSWVDKVEDFKPEERNGLFKEFSQSATVHGLRRTTEARYGRFRRGVWVLAFLGMLAGLLYTVLSQVVSMMTYPTLTQQSLDFRSKLMFPAVTLCNLNQFRKSVIGDDERGKLMLLATSDLASQANVNLNDSLWNVTYTAEDSAEMDKIVKFFGHNIYDSLISCTWDNKVYECWDLFVTQKTDFGMCYTFNGVTSGNFTPRETVHSGSKYGLTVLINVQQEEYVLGAYSDAAGLRVLLHDPYETPLVDGRGFDVSPGTATKASIKMTKDSYFVDGTTIDGTVIVEQEIHNPEVKYLPPPYTSQFDVQCTNTSLDKFKNFLSLYDRYDLAACVAECRYNYIVDACGCRNVFDRGNATFCSPLNTLECYLPHFDKFLFEDSNCSCPMPCELNLFDAEVSMSLFPSLAMAEQANALFKINLTEAKFRQNYLKLTLAYDNFIVEEIRQVPEFTLGSIMSTLGGQLGFFIGASTLSLLEFLEFGLELFFFKFLGLGKKIKPSSASQGM